MAPGSTTVVPHRALSEEVQQEVNGWLYNLEAQNVQLASRQDVIFKYNVSFNNALAGMFAQMNPSFESQFLMAPTLPIFPPSDQEEESDEEVDDEDWPN